MLQVRKALEIQRKNVQVRNNDIEIEIFVLGSSRPVTDESGIPPKVTTLSVLLMLNCFPNIK